MSDYPFDIIDFITNNTALVKKYLSKNTYGIYVPDVFTDKEHYYKNNQIILRACAPVFEYSDLQKLEYIKCMKDVVYFARKYVKIISIDDGIIPFNLYQFQEELLELYQKHRFVISMQARQTGKCASQNTHINIRNKATNEIKRITIGEFHKLQSKTT